jgi:hypothetical protein
MIELVMSLLGYGMLWLVGLIMGYLLAHWEMQ